MEKLYGKISSIETMGLNDGPGIRNVIFFQGCNLRCKYCHNPETWDFDGGIRKTSDELLNVVLKYKNYFNVSGGGVTCSGGEPLEQVDFLTEFFKKCKENNIHTAIDSAGYYDNKNINDEKILELLKYTDLVILDIKHVCETGFYKVTGGKIQVLNKFLELLAFSKSRLWLRHVVMPGLTDGEIHIERVRKFMTNIENVDKIEFLPYHSMGLEKYENA